MEDKKIKRGLYITGAVLGFIIALIGAPFVVAGFFAAIIPGFILLAAEIGIIILSVRLIRAANKSKNKMRRGIEATANSAMPLMQSPVFPSAEIESINININQGRSVAPTQPMGSETVTIHQAPITVQALSGLKSFVVLDTETTGLNRTKDKIIEIGIVSVCEGTKNGEFHSLVNPEMHIDGAASAVNGIVDADVADAPVIKAVINQINDVIADNVVVGHNIQFDLAFISGAMEDAQISRDIIYIDTVTLAKKAFPGRKTYKLASLATDFHLASAQTHRALDDVYLTLALFELCRAELIKQHQAELLHRKELRAQAKAEKARLFAWSPMLNKNIVFTGEFDFDRSMLEKKAEEVGAVVRPQVNSNTDYIVVGNLSNLPQWALERKYLKAVTIMESGGKLRKLDELTFIQLIKDVLRQKPKNDVSAERVEK